MIAFPAGVEVWIAGEFIWPVSRAGKACYKPTPMVDITISIASTVLQGP